MRQEHNPRKGKQVIDLEAFCATCPPPDEVTNLLQRLDFRLTFQMDAVAARCYGQIPALPAQYHYSDQYGTEVIYLAGSDADTDGRQLPTHASRFWLFPGSDPDAYQHTGSQLALRWRFRWLLADAPGSCQEIA